MSKVSANVRLYGSDGALCLHLDFNFSLYLYFSLYLMFSNLDLSEYANVLEASADVRWWPCRQQSRREREGFPQFVWLSEPSGSRDRGHLQAPAVSYGIRGGSEFLVRLGHLQRFVVRRDS